MLVGVWILREFVVDVCGERCKIIECLSRTPDMGYS